MIRPGFLATIQTPLRAAALRSYATQQAAKTVTVTSSKSNESSALLGNLEASWKNLSAEDRYAVEEKLAEVTKKDWKEMTPVEQDAAYFLMYGKHLSRSTKTSPQHGAKTLFWTGVGFLSASLGFLTYRSLSPEPVPSMSKEYQEASNEYMRSQNLNPISGISSEGYKGKGMVQFEK